MSDGGLSGKRVESSEDAPQLGSGQAVESPSGLSLQKREEWLEEKKKSLSQELEKSPRREGVPNELRDETLLALLATEEKIKEVNELKGGASQLSGVGGAASSSSSSPTAQPEAGGERMTVMQVRMSKTLTNSSRYQELFGEWYRVHSENFNELLPPKGNEQRLVDLLDQWESNPERKKLLASQAQAKREKWVEERSEWPVFKLLVAGLENEQGNDAKLDKLLANFKAVGAQQLFKYTMDALDSDKFLQGGGEGDCNTLMHAFRYICLNMLGIDCEIRSSEVDFPGRFLTPEHRTIDGETGNVDGRDCKYWVFENHYWAQCGGKAYDVLFGELGPPKTESWLKMQNSDRDRVWIFGEGPRQIKVTLVNPRVVNGRYRQVD